MPTQTPAMRARFLVGGLLRQYPTGKVGPDNLSQLITAFHHLANTVGGHYLASLPENQPEDTLVHAYWFNDEGFDEAHVILIYYQSTGRFEVGPLTSGTPPWLAQAVARATTAAKRNP